PSGSYPLALHDALPIFRVNLSWGAVSTTRGQKKSFQAPWKVKMVSAPRAGLARGKTTRVKVCQGVAPSIRADSSSSRGREMKNWRMMKTALEPTSPERSEERRV